MKSVLISIKPKWCELIASGKKTIEVRNTRPKIETPFKCYIYCTHDNHKNALHLYVNSGYGRKDIGVIGHWRSGKDVIDVNHHLPAYRYNAYLAEGKVIGEFVCDKIYDIEPHYDTPNFCNQYVCGWNAGDEDDCISFSDFDAYLGGKHGYGWHISDLKIYEKPRELSEFWAYNEELHKRYDSEEGFCCYDDTNEYGEALTDCGDAYNNIQNCYRCWEELSGWCHHVTRPTQSWCYVEELQDV